MPTATATDSFNRPNTTNINGQTTETGGLVYQQYPGYAPGQILTNRYTSPSGASILDTASTDHAIEASSSATGNNQLGFRHVDANNRLGVYWSGTNLDLYKVVAGTVTDPVPGGQVTGLTRVDGDRLRAQVDGDTVRVWLNGTLRITYTITDAVLRTGTTISILAFTGGATWWDDLAIDFVFVIPNAGMWTFDNGSQPYDSGGPYDSYLPYDAYAPVTLRPVGSRRKLRVALIRFGCLLLR